MFVGELTVLNEGFISYMNVDIDISTLLWEGTTTYITCGDFHSLLTYCL